MKRSTFREKLRSRIATFFSDQRGSMITLTAVSMTAVMGFAGLGVDVAMWYSEKRSTQSMADAAAVAATYAIRQGANLADVQAAAHAEAVRNGFTDTAGNEITVSNATGTVVAGGVPVADIVVKRRVPVFLAGLFLQDNPSVTATSTGGVRTLGDLCVIGLDRDASKTVNFAGNSEAYFRCGVSSDSSAEDSLFVGGNAILMANPAQAYGDIVVANGGTLISEVSPLTLSQRIGDPFANGPHTLVTEAMGACDNNGVDVNGVQTLDPAVDGTGTNIRICGDFTVRPGSLLMMQPGTYYVEGGNVLFQGTVIGDGVTIVLTGATSSDVGTIDIRAQSAVSLSAPSTGDYAGIVVYQNKIAGPDGDNKFNGGASMAMNGVIHIANQSVTYNGGMDVVGCTKLVARLVKFVGTSFLRNTPSVCTAIGLENAGTEQEQVVLLQ